MLKYAIQVDGKALQFYYTFKHVLEDAKYLALETECIYYIGAYYVDLVSGEREFMDIVCGIDENGNMF